MVDPDLVETNDTEQEIQRRPLKYFDNVRTNSSFSYETQQGSAMYRVYDTFRNETIRLAHIESLNPYSEMQPDGSRFLVDLVFYIEAAAFLAMHHFNERSSQVLPNLPNRLQECNIYMTFDILDTLFSPLTASGKLVELISGQTTSSLAEPPVLAVAGAARSGVSEPLAVLTGVYEIPMVNGVSTSSSLDSKDSSPTFVRTAPNNRLDSQAIVTYLRHLHVTHFGVIFVKDPYGSEFSRDLRVTAEKYNITVISAAYHDGNEQDIANAVRTLQKSQFRYFFAAITPSALACKAIIQNAVELGIAGNPDYMWLWPETNLIETGFYETTLNSSLESDRTIAEAITGMGMILIDVPINERFDSALSEMGRDEELYDYFLSKHDAPPELFDGFDWKPRPFFYQYFSYDYIMALGIALCDMEEDFPTGPRIVEAIKATEFTGVSGPVSFDSFTGTRRADSVTFKLVNVVVNVTEDSITPNFFDSALINGGTEEVEELIPYVYAQGSSEPPLPLPPLTVDTNLIGIGARIAGWCLAGVVVLLSLGFALWTYRNRTKNVIRVAQPFFLFLLCAGTTLMALAIIPMSYEEPMSEKVLNRGCMTTWWLFTMGFATAFSSLFCKTLRLDKLFRQSAGMRRVKVEVKDVIWPFVLISVVNFALLLAWTLVAPLQWSRVEVQNYDSFGRSVESYGSCFVLSDDVQYTTRQSKSRTGFLIALGLFNFGAVVLANYEIYRTRKLPSDFNESFYLALSMVSILEGFLIGVPILFLAYKTPTVLFVVSSLFVAFLCLGILLPTFVSKIFMRRKGGLRKSEWHAAWSTYESAGAREARRSSGPSIASGGRSAELSLQNSLHGETDEHNTGRFTVADIRARASKKTSQYGSAAETDDHSSGRFTVADIRARASKKTSQYGSAVETEQSGRVTVADIRARAAKKVSQYESAADAEQSGRVTVADIRARAAKKASKHGIDGGDDSSPPIGESKIKLTE